MFATDKPTIRKYDNMMSVTYTNASNQTHGSSFFIQGTLHDVVTMLRRVNQEYRLTEQFERGGLVRLKSALIRAGPIYSGEVIAVADPNTSAHLDNGMIATIPEAEKKVSRSEKRSMAKMEREEERHRREQIMMRRKPRSLKKHPETNTLPADKEQDVYHGTSIMPADKEERETYHGTSIMPADKEERETYHGTSIMPADNEEREVYHGTNIMPAEKEEKETYHGTLIAPEEMLYQQVAPESDSFDINDYMGAEDRWVEVTPQRRFKSFAQQHHEDLHRPPKEHVTWDDIRRRHSCVCIQTRELLLLILQRTLILLHRLQLILHRLLQGTHLLQIVLRPRLLERLLQHLLRRIPFLEKHVELRHLKVRVHTRRVNLDCLLQQRVRSQTVLRLLKRQHRLVHVSVRPARIRLLRLHETVLRLA